MLQLTPRVVAEAICELLNRSYSELNGEFYIQLTQDEKHTLVVSEIDENVVVKNFIPEIPKAYLEYLMEVLAEYPEIRGDFVDGVPALIVGKSCSYDRLRSALKSVYETYAYDKPADAYRLFSGFIVKFLDERFCIVSSVENIGRLFSDNYISLPDEDGWFRSRMGLDNTHLPILCWKKNGSILTYVPSVDGSLKVFNVSEFLEKIQKLFESIKINFKVINEVELFRKLHEVEGNIELAKAIIEGGTIPFISSTPESKLGLSDLLRDVEEDLKKLKRAIVLSEFIEQRVVSRLIIRLAAKILKGESGVLSTSVRKVSKLGAGYAIYISKDEAKTLRLTDSAIVKVIAEEGHKPKIIIQ